MNSNKKIRVSKIWSRGHLENLPHPSDGTSPPRLFGKQTSQNHHVKGEMSSARRDYQRLHL